VIEGLKGRLAAQLLLLHPAGGLPRRVLACLPPGGGDRLIPTRFREGTPVCAIAHPLAELLLLLLVGLLQPESSLVELRCLGPRTEKSVREDLRATPQVLHLVLHVFEDGPLAALLQKLLELLGGVGAGRNTRRLHRSLPAAVIGLPATFVGRSLPAATATLVDRGGFLRGDRRYRGRCALTISG